MNPMETVLGAFAKHPAHSGPHMATTSQMQSPPKPPMAKKKSKGKSKPKGY